MGTRRQRAAGRCRATIISGRTAGGTHTIRRPARSALTVAAATASGLVASGCALRPAVIFERTNPGRTISTMAPAAGERVAEPLGEAVEACLRRAVHVVGLAHPLAGDARQDDQATVALAAELRRHDRAHAHRPGEVDVDEGGGRRRIVGELGGVAELTEGDDGDVEVAVRRRRADRRAAVFGGVGGVERARRRRRRRGRAVPRRRPRRGVRAASTTVVVAGDTKASTIALPMSLVPPNSTIVCASPRALSITVSPTRLGEAQAAALVARPAAVRIDARRGPPATRRDADSRGGSLRAWRRRPWRGSAARRRRARRRRARRAARRDRRRAAGMSRVSVQPGAGKAQRCRVGRAEPLEHGEEAGRAATRRSGSRLGAAPFLGAERDEELVLHEPAPAVQAVPRPDRVERVEEPRDRHDLADPPPRRGPEPDLVEGGDAWCG